MKAIILARGLGTRMRAPDESAALDATQAEAAGRGHKALMPFGRPFLDYSLSSLADAGYRDICLVIAPESEIAEHYQRNPPRRVRLHHAVQAEPRGTADAVLAAESFAGEDEFAVLNSDNLYPSECLRSIRQLDGPGLAAFPAASLLRDGNIPPERLRAFAVLSVTSDRRLAGIVEKPTATLSPDALISMNLWRFGPEIFPFCRDVEESSRGELELPRAVADAVASGMRLQTVLCRGPVLDLSSRGDIAAVARHLAHRACDP